MIQDAEDLSIAALIHQSLIPSIRLELFPKSTIGVFLTILENDGIDSCVATGTVTASTALTDAGIEMLGLVICYAAVSPDSSPAHRLIDPVENVDIDGRRDLARPQSRKGHRGCKHTGVGLYACSERSDERLAKWDCLLSKDLRSALQIMGDASSILRPTAHGGLPGAMCNNTFNRPVSRLELCARVDRPQHVDTRKLRSRAR